MHIHSITNLPKRNGVHPDTSLLMDREEVNPMQKAITKGFTLIELLVVIAIIGILAAVVLVAINPAARIAEANDSKAKSNLGQVATALEACYTANQGSYAAGQCDTASNLNLKGYLKQNLGQGWPATPGSVAVKVTAANDNAVAYSIVTAASNIAAGTTCPSGQVSYITYHTNTGATSAKGAACVASGAANEPTAP